MKNTRQREALAAVLRAAAEPLTAEELHLALPPGEAMALSTIYRNLERFAAEGIAEKELFGDGTLRWLSAARHGHYLVCTGCAAKIKLCDCPVHALEDGISRETGFAIEGHSLTLYGLCPACRHPKK